MRKKIHLATIYFQSDTQDQTSALCDIFQIFLIFRFLGVVPTRIVLVSFLNFLDDAFLKKRADYIHGFLSVFFDTPELSKIVLQKFFNIGSVWQPTYYI